MSRENPHADERRFRGMMEVLDRRGSPARATHRRDDAGLAHALLRIIDDVLDFSKIAGRLAPRPRSLALRPDRRR
jgi:asparagine synthetase B (glutamine-hydrolysing)